MGIPEKQKDVKLIVSLIFKDRGKLGSAIKKLRSLFGETEDLEADLEFEYTDYYYEEFGKPLKRKIICFKKLISLENISKIKLETNKIENDLAVSGKRTVNIDPGYVTEAKLVLLTTKDYTHRVYVGDLIFAESTLNFKDGTFDPWPWTYPDYGSRELVDHFNSVRELYMRQIRKGEGKN